MASGRLDGLPLAMKWWGWGDRAKRFQIEGHPDLAEFLKTRLETTLEQEFPPVSLESILLAPSRLDRAQVDGLERILGESGISRDKLSRLEHAMGKSYRDVVRSRKGEVSCPPDAVLYPSGEEEIGKILEWASEHEVAVVPFGGGTSVVGGVEALGAEHHRAVISLDLCRLSRILHVDERSRTVRAQAGIRGPSLEEGLSGRGFTLGHFPQSFEYSTLGGWVATRSAGQQSTLYGKIEHMVQSLRMIHPGGTLETLSVPARAAGPDWNQIVTGSEGILGVITEVTLKLWPAPVRRRIGAFFFRDFREGAEASRKFLQNGLVPATLRVSDPEETQFGMILRPRSEDWKKQAFEHTGVWALEKMGYRQGKRCLMILGFEGDPESTDSDWKHARRICSDHGGFYLGRKPGMMWYRDRFEHPYLRDTLMDKGVLIDTVETSTTWENLVPLYEALQKILVESIRQTGVQGIVMAHLSHCYPSGSSLYFIFLAKQVQGEEMEQWWAIKKAASECILAHHGTISHHHGIGIDHARWAEKEHGPSAMKGLKGLKNSLDPKGIMNPGKILPVPVCIQREEPRIP